jgi:hypothetical protein
MPTVKFCSEVYSLDPSTHMTTSAVAALLDTFGPDLINYALTCLFMTLNLLYLQRYRQFVNFRMTLPCFYFNLKPTE